MMLTIANNISTRNPNVRQAFWRLKRGIWRHQQAPETILKELAEKCAAAGADVLEINIQQYYDRPEAMEFAVNNVQGNHEDNAPHRNL